MPEILPRRASRPVSGRVLDDDRVPTHDLQAEESLLGAALQSRDAIAVAVGLCRPSDFYRPAHKHIFSAMSSLYERGEHVDLVTVEDQLRRDGLLEEAGGRGELIALHANTPALLGARRYAGIIADWAAARSVQTILSELDLAAAMGNLREAAPGAVERLLALRLGPARTAAQLVIEDIATVVARVDDTQDVRWLARPVWPGDAYGMLGASMKVGKTWIMLDLAVAVASGGAWLGTYPVETPGPVLVFLGEGGERKMVRRLRAIAESKGAPLTDLPLWLCHRAPNLTSADHLAEIRQEVQRRRPALVIVDPLYLAAGNAKSESLFAMGDVLVGLQVLCQEVGASLVISHHWNRKTGTGDGPERMTGAGPAEWGRVLVSVSLQHQTTNPDRSTAATLQVTFMGDEIPETELHLRRRVWADDPDDLASPLHYELEVLTGNEAEAGPGSLRPAARRVLAALRQAGDWLSVSSIGDLLALDGSGRACLKERTIQAALTTLAEKKLARSAPLGTGSSHAQLWRAGDVDLEVESAF
jgi:hypothetical protein